MIIPQDGIGLNDYETDMTHFHDPQFVLQLLKIRLRRFSRDRSGKISQALGIGEATSQTVEESGIGAHDIT